MQDSRIGPGNGPTEVRDIALTSTVVVSPRQVSTTLNDDATILGEEAGQYFGLDGVGARIWELVQEPVQVSAICTTVCDEYDVTPETCERDVLALLGALRAQGLLDVRGPASAS